MAHAEPNQVKPNNAGALSNELIHVQNLVQSVVLIIGVGVTGPA